MAINKLVIAAILSKDLKMAESLLKLEINLVYILAGFNYIFK